MSGPRYPFTSIVGQPQLKLALLLASVDWRLSVLLKGDKGSGKTTAARGLADILPAGAPFVNLPIGVSEDRLLGGLDLNRAFQGEAALKRGLIHEAHGGVLYIDEVNLLSDSLTDTLLDVASSGHHFVERDGFSVSAEARFILLGSMNIEEGALRPQLLDRFALALDVEAPAAPEERALILESRLRFDAEPVVFCAAVEDEQERLRLAIVEARELVPGIRPAAEFLQEISQAVTEAGVRSLRADLATLRAAIAHAALCRRSQLEREDIEAVLPLVLHHRAKRNPGQTPPVPQNNRQAPEQPGDGQSGASERVYPPEPKQSPRLVIAKPPNESLNIMGSFVKSFRNTGTAALNGDQLAYRSTPPKSGVRFIFAVDSSGSQGAQQRMRAVKGAVAGLLESSVNNKDEIAVIAFRGAKAEIVLEPCKDSANALRVLEFLPTGGRTPLAHALQLAESLLTTNCLLILLTDGRANVPLSSADPWDDALRIAGKLRCPSLLVDSSTDNSTMEAIAMLASALRAKLIRLDELNDISVVGRVFTLAHYH